MDVSVIIVNWNTRQLLCDCLNSLKESTRNISYEVFVVDNNSSDDSVEMVQECFPDVNLIVNDTNAGFAAANNQAMEKSQGRYVLLLNSDTVVHEDAIETTVNFADYNLSAAVIGCRVMNTPEDVEMTCFRFPSLLSIFFSSIGMERIFKKSRMFGRDRMLWWQRDTFRRVDVVSGMYMLVRQKAIDEVGMMDESFFFYYEETDWCYRFAKAGWKALFNPEAVITHIGGGGQSSAKARQKTFVQLQKSCMIYFRKNKGPVYAFAARMILATGYFSRAVAWSILCLRGKVSGGDCQGHFKRKADSAAAVRFLLFGIEPD
jgi:GT2 family glycosyltransferase